MDIYKKIQELASKEKIAVSDLETRLDLGNGTIGKWTKSIPKVDKLYKVAQYFSLPLEYFLIEDITETSPSKNLTTAIALNNAEEVCMEINERIFYLLNIQKKTAKDLGAFINVNPSSISAWKNESSYPSSKSIIGISEFFGVSIDFLFTGKEYSPELSSTSTHIDHNATFEKYSLLTKDDQEEIDALIDIKYKRAFPQNCQNQSTCSTGKTSEESDAGIA